MTHAEKTRELFREGYNCAQSVTLAFAGEMGLDEKTTAKLASAFGGGVGRTREVCGCVSGMAFVAGMLRGYSDPRAKEEKRDLYALVQEMIGEFKEKNGSIICRELLAGVPAAKSAAADTNPQPEARTEEYYKKRPCMELCAAAAEILERKLLKGTGYNG